MKPQRIEQLLENQTALARKVFDSVPIQEPWSSQVIHGEVRKVSGADYHTVCGCLADLKNQGLIREVSRKRYQRYPVTATLADVMPEGLTNRQPTIEHAALPQKDTVMTDLTLIKPTAGKPADALSRLAELAQKVRKTAAIHQAAMNELADGIDEVALSVEAEREANGKSMEKFHQLQGLLKAIGAGE